jgi:tetratricopeptide (TPR) repeat protein
LAKVLRERRIGSVEVAFRPLALMGFCVAGIADRRRIAGRTAVYIAAPLLMHALILLALLPMLQVSRVVTALAWAEMFFLVNAVVLAENLYPRQVKVGPTVLNSDGMWLWQFARGRVNAEQLHAAYFLLAMVYAFQARTYQRAVEVARAGLALYPDHLYLRNGLAVGLISLEDYQEAAPILHELLDQGDDLPPDVRALVLNNLATIAVGQDAADLELSQAVDYAREAYRLVPWIPEVRGTLGAALVVHGQTDESLLHLLAVYPDLLTDQARSYNLAFQALAQWQQGNVAGAAVLLQRAVQFDPENRTVTRVQTWISQQSDQPDH